MSLFEKYKKRLTAFTYLYVLILDLMNASIFLIALPQITSDLNISIALSSLMQILYLIAIISVIPISSLIYNICGGKLSFIIAICIFSLSSILCFFTSNLFGLLFFRALQGIGGGLLIPIGQTMTFTEYQANERLKVSSIIQSVSSVSPLLAPYIGALIMKYLGWKYIFLLTGISGFLIVPIIGCLPEKFERNKIQYKTPSFEIMNIILFVISSIFIFNGIELLNNKFWYIYLILVMILIYSLINIIVLFKHNKIKLINLKIFDTIAFNKSLLQFFIYGFYFTSFFFINTFFLQTQLKFSAKIVSFVMIAYVIPQTFSSFLCKYCKDILLIIILGQILFCIGLFIFVISAYLKFKMLIIYIILAEILAGFGAGFIGPLIFIRAFSYSKNNISDISTIWNLNRQYTYIIANSITSSYLSFVSFSQKYILWYILLIIFVFIGILLAVQIYTENRLHTKNLSQRGILRGLVSNKRQNLNKNARACPKTIE